MTSCITPSKTDSKNNEFYVACGNTVFKRFLHEFDNVNDDYLNYIKEINDPILRHISLYLVQYYIDGHYYYSYSHSSHKNGACDYLKRWLLERKDLFTYGEKCPTKMKLWQDHVEPLWDKLEKGYPIQNHGGISWCKNEYPISQKTEYPHVLRSLNCEECTSKESSSAQCPPPSVQTQSTCRPCPVYVSSPETVPPQEAGHPPKTDQLSGTDRTKNLAVTSGFTAVGTLGTLFFLYRFTPMMSWFRRPGMNNVGTDLYMNPGGAESFLSMQQDNGSNNLFYHP